MTNYIVRSGDMVQIVEAENPADAAVLAFKQTKARSFGLITEMQVQGTTDPDNETWLGLTERYAKEAGLELSFPPGYPDNIDFDALDDEN